MSEHNEPVVTPGLAREHGLSDQEWARILELLGRTPSWTELGIFSVMWSEHCSYKSSKKHLGLFPTSGPHVLQGPGENAGIIDIGDNLAVAFKMESHNHPSYIEPYQGAATGVGGILRDVFTMGARTIASLDSLKFGRPGHPRTAYLLHGVVAGIAGYGNCMGVPTVGGETTFDESYDGNILVNAFTLGLVRHDRIWRGYASGPGNPVMYVGSKTGRDGIHGATMASEEFDRDSEEKRPTVQVGDPFTEKLLLEACLELMAGDHIVGIQDMGAAGLTSSSFEMAGRAGTGIEMNLDLIPLREEGMTPYEMMLSESQERMLLVAREGHEQTVRDIFHKWDLEAVVVGRVTDTGRMVCTHRGRTVVDMPIAPLHAAAPVYDRPRRRPEWLDGLASADLSGLPEPDDYQAAFTDLVCCPNQASKRWIYDQYDHMVHTNTVVLPGSDAAVIRIKGTDTGVAMSVKCNSRYCLLDPYEGARIALAENARNVSCAGATPSAITDCLNFGNPEKPEIMWQFVECVRGLADACRDLETPVVSGNVSFYNDTEGRSINPTPTVGMVGLMKHPERAATQHFKGAGDSVWLLGETRGEFGGSEYLKQRFGRVEGRVPPLDMAAEKAVQACIRDLVGLGLVRSAHDCSDGGLAVALAECCLTPAGPGVGAVIEPPAGIRLDRWLFGEDQSRIVVSVPPAGVLEFETVCRRHGVPVGRIGTTGGERLRIGTAIDLDLAALHAVWSSVIPAVAAGTWGRE